MRCGASAGRAGANDLAVCFEALEAVHFAGAEALAIASLRAPRVGFHAATHDALRRPRDADLVVATIRAVRHFAAIGDGETRAPAAGSVQGSELTRGTGLGQRIARRLRMVAAAIEDTAPENTGDILRGDPREETGVFDAGS